MSDGSLFLRPEYYGAWVDRGGGLEKRNINNAVARADDGCSEFTGHSCVLFGFKLDSKDEGSARSSDSWAEDCNAP